MLVEEKLQLQPILSKNYYNCGDLLVTIIFLKSKKDIQSHYDVGGEKGEKLYDIFLDKKHRQYSCAYWKNSNETLEDAQQNKLNHIISKLNIKPGQKILDIGCGWGGMSFEIARQKKCEVVGISLSKNQIKHRSLFAKQAFY